MTEKKYIRPNWDEYFIKLMKEVGKRSTCDRGRTGCIIVRDKRILSTGYAGSPNGLPHCDDVGHEFHTVFDKDGNTSKHCIRTTHAEQNAIANAAKEGVALKNSTLYCTMTPCYICAKIIINSGIKKVIAEKDYQKSERSKEIFKEANIDFVLLNKNIEKY